MSPSLTCPDCKRVFTPQAGTQQAMCPSCAGGLSEWYCARGKKKVGPFSATKLHALAVAGKLVRTDMVLRPGAQKWVAAGDVPELFPAPPPLPTPAPPAAAQPTPSPSPSPSAAATPAGAFFSRHQVLAEGQVVPDGTRCVQCGCCSYNCPIGIDVRAHAWRSQPIHASHCLTCGECVRRCPRGVLSFERVPLVS